MEKSTDLLQVTICKLLYPFVIETARRGKYKNAEDLLRFVLNHDSSPEYLLLLGKVYAQQGRYEEAITEWRKALELDPANQEVKTAIQRAEKPSKLFYRLSEVFKENLAYVIICVLLMASIGVSFSLRALKNDKQALIVKHGEIIVKYGEIQKQFVALKKKSDLNDMVNKTLSENGLSDFTIVANQNNDHLSLKGEVPTEYLKDRMGMLIVGQVKDIEEVDVKSVKVGHRYSVLRGDTLGEIAQRLYGKYIKWNVIFAANQDKITTPDELIPGISLYIP